MEESVSNGRNPDGTFAQGNPGGPGRPELTDEERAKKQALKEYVAEYRETLQELLRITPLALKKKIEEGDVSAIRELHERTLGKVDQKIEVTAPKPILGGLTNAIQSDNSSQQDKQPK